jgi:hypothetical protein
VKARHIAAAGAALVALAGCSAKPAGGPPPAAAHSAAPAVAPAASPSASPSASMDAGTLDAASGFLTGLGKLDAKLVADQSVALDNGAATCIDILDRKPEAEQERNTATRYAVDAARARKIIALAKAELCLE